MNNRLFGIVGCGDEGAKLLKKCYVKKIHVDYVFDSYKKGEFFGKTIRPITDIQSMRSIFLVVSTAVYFNEIRNQLLTYEMVEYKDFIKSEVFEKKITIIYGNCYATAISKLLKSNSEFNNSYYIIGDTPIYTMTEDEVIKYKSKISYVDLFLHQDLRDNNGLGKAYSIENIGSLKCGCKEIIFPNLFGFGKAFFQKHGLGNKNNKKTDELPGGMFPYADDIIDKLSQKGFSISEIVKIIMSGNIFSYNKVNDNFNVTVNKFIEREKYWDIKCMEYILNLYKEKRTFYDLAHPTNEVMIYIANGILKNLGIEGGVTMKKFFFQLHSYRFIRKSPNILDLHGVRIM